MFLNNFPFILSFVVVSYPHLFLSSSSFDVVQIPRSFNYYYFLKKVLNLFVNFAVILFHSQGDDLIQKRRKISKFHLIVLTTLSLLP